MIRGITALSSVLICAIASAQSTSTLDSKMESSLIPYWSKPETISSSINSDDNVEHQIFEKHKEAVSRVSNIGIPAVKAVLSHIVNEISSQNTSYSRISCGGKICEIVMAFPHTPGDSEKAKYIINTFYDRINSRSNIYKVITPSMIIDGPNGRDGFTMLFYVSIN